MLLQWQNLKIFGLGYNIIYIINDKTRTIPLADLEIGSRVVDPSWLWQFKTGANYSYIEGDITKPVVWIVVAKDHFDNMEPHVALLSQELIGKIAFDKSTNRGSRYGSNHWGESGTTNAAHGLRPWINSTGIHNSEGFYLAFSENFKEAVIVTALPNKEWENGNAYITNDKVFLPSTAELGDRSNNYTYSIGSAYTYFSGTDNAKRAALLGSETLWYWTRSPVSYSGYRVRIVYGGGVFNYDSAYRALNGVRPAVNLKSDTMVYKLTS